MIDHNVFKRYINLYGFNIEYTVLDDNDKKLLHVYDEFELKFWKSFLSNNNIDEDTIITINDMFLYQLFDKNEYDIQGYYKENNHYLELRKFIYGPDITKEFNDKNIEYHHGYIFVYVALKYNQSLYDSYIKTSKLKQKILNIYTLLNLHNIKDLKL